ncbi:MAG: metallophosphoesterase family protein, partial [Pseudomonadota bacterium]
IARRTIAQGTIAREAIDCAARSGFMQPMTIYAIGDIHGHLNLLRRAHEAVEADRARRGTARAKLIHVGDLVDRGPDSAGVVDYLAGLTATDDRVRVLRGNHDHMLLEFLNGTPKSASPRGAFDYLARNIGGRSTLESYGLNTGQGDRALLSAAAEKVPESHKAFLAALPFSHQEEECLFVHAGIRPGVALAEQDPLDLIWIRDEFLIDVTDHGPLIVHGHTPADKVEHWGNRLNLDSGAAYGGPVSAVAIEGREAFLLTESGRERVRIY